ncbi:MAG: tetratricopeptide repeat protein [Rhodospirillaceae bacterium]|nr:tetratricopeptide repeat protein [Rhodospirillaceae bacterium]
MANTKSDRLLEEGLAHQRDGRLDEAEAVYRKIIATDANDADAHHLLGLIALSRRAFDVAANRIAEAVRLNPRDERYHLNYATALRGQDRLADALEALDRALEIKPDYIEAWFNRGVMLAQGGAHAEALVSFDKALALRPDAAALHYNRGNALYALKRPGEAAQSYEAAIAIQPQNAETHYNLGVVRQDLNQWADALAAYDQAVFLDPQHAGAHNNRGAVLAQMRRFDEALKNYDAAIALKPKYAEAYNNRGHVLTELKRYPDARASYQKAFTFNPEIEFLPGVLLNAKLLLCEWRGLDDNIDTVLSGLDDGAPVTTPFALLALPASLAQQRACADIHVSRKVTAEPLPFGPHHSSGKIRLGYFSPDFRSHPVSFLTAGLIESHDRAKFEIYGFSYGSDDADPVRERMAKAFNRFIDIRSLSDADAVAQARALNLDIAVDLAGYTQNARSNIFAMRAAPVQVNYLGLPATMGGEFMDYIIADDTVIPPEHRAAYAEKSIVMPHTFQVNDSTRAVPQALSRAEAGLPEDAFVFCSFSNTYKYNPDLFEVWMRIMRDAPNSVLWLLGENPTQEENLKYAAAERGVPPKRLVFAPRVPLDRHMARYALADLVLDTLPFNGGTTTSDALWAGTPVLTCLGRTYAGRMAGSLLKAAGVPELIAPSLAEYEAMAAGFAEMPESIAVLKQKLAAARKTSALFDTQGFTKHLEMAFTQAVARNRAGQPPDHIIVKS